MSEGVGVRKVEEKLKKKKLGQALNRGTGDECVQQVYQHPNYEGGKFLHKGDIGKEQVLGLVKSGKERVKTARPPAPSVNHWDKKQT